MSVASKPMDWIFAGREERARWVAEKYRDFIGDSVLDVGCWQRDLQRHLPPHVHYTGVDIGGDPDLYVDLEQGGLPFQDASFDTVVCTEVLEHLEHAHAIMDEILRVARRYAIVSLPNNYAALRLDVPLGRHRPPKFYGLPPEPPEDRHRWFFNFTQAEQFLRHRVEKAGGRVLEIHALQNPNSHWLKRLGRIVIAPDLQRRRNLFAVAIYALLEPPPRASDGSRP